MKLYEIKIHKADKRTIKRYTFGGLTFLSKSRDESGRETRFFGIVVSKHKSTANAFEEEKRDLSFLRTESMYSGKLPLTKQRGQIDIVIPIYNGFEFLEDLFHSLFLYTDVSYRVIVVDDKSSDPRVKKYLYEQKDIFGNSLTVIENSKNIGFVKSVNRAFSQIKNDVVLLNSDIVLPKNWASRLLEPIFNDSRVASVTPFTNETTFFSIPKFGYHCPHEAHPSQIDSAFSQLIYSNRFIKLTNGGGGCMALSLAAINKIGFFDEIFEKGHGVWGGEGEAVKNDWCQRAIEIGFYNTLAPNLFVYHKHGVSLSLKEKKNFIDNNSKIISTRYPDYFKETEKLLKNPYFLMSRFCAEILFFNVNSPKNILWIQHSYGGGAEIYLKRKIQNFNEKTLHVILRTNNEKKYNRYILEYSVESYKNRIEIQEQELKVLLNCLCLNEIRVNNLAGYLDFESILNLIHEIKINKKVTVLYLLHDFLCICPTIQLIRNDSYCFVAEKGMEQCSNCLRNNTYYYSLHCTQFRDLNILEFREIYSSFLENTCDKIIVFSESSKKILLSVYPAVRPKIVIKPHTLPNIKKAPFTVGILGAIGFHKGAFLLSEIDKIIPKHPELNFIIVGYADRKYKNIDQTGKYKLDELDELIRAEKIDAFFIPSVWPETFSFTTAEAINTGLPVFCLDFGAQAEKVSRYEKGLVLKHHFSKEKLICDIYMFLRDNL